MGHHGFNRTCKQIEEYLHNNVVKADNGKRLTQPPPAMRDHVSVFLWECLCCQKPSKFKKPITTQPFTSASYFPFDKVVVNTIGPLPPKNTEISTQLFLSIDSYGAYVYT